MSNNKTEPITAGSILQRAAGHQADRAAVYDKPEGERSMAQTVAVFEAFHGIKLTEAQGWHFMQVLKDVRLFTRPAYHADSAEDCVSYAALKAEAKAKETPPPANDNIKGPIFHAVQTADGMKAVAVCCGRRGACFDCPGHG